MPPIPTTIQLFGGASGGSHEGLGALDVAEFYSSEDSINVYVEKSGPLGQVKKILGYLAQNASKITTDTGGSATKVVGLLPYRSMSGGTTTRHLLAVVDDGTNEYEVHKSTNSASTWAFLKELGTTVGLIPDSAQMDNDLFLTDGKGTPQQYNGTTMANVGGTQSPTPSASATGKGALRGAYRYKLLSLKANKARQIGSALSAEVRVEDTKMTVTWSADADGTVIGYELYRTTGDGLTFYRVDYIDGRTTTSYVDNTSNENVLQGITLEEHGDPPIAGMYFVEAHKQRMWWGRTDANPRRVWYSDPGDADSVYEDNNFLEFTDARSASDQVTGMTGNFTDALVVWQEYSVWAATGTGEVVNNVTDWTRWRTSASMGTVSHRSVAEVPAGAKFPGIDGSIVTIDGPVLAYFTPFNTINILIPSGGDYGDQIISFPKEDFLASVQFQYRHLVVCEHDKARGHIRWYFPHGSSQTVNNKGVQWDYRHGTWSELSDAPFACAATIEKTNEAEVLLTGEARVATGGLVYQNWSGNSANGSGNNITADFWTKGFFGKDQNGRPLVEQRIQWHWVEPVTGAAASQLFLSVFWYDGYDNAGATARGTNAAIDMQGSNATHVVNRVDLLDSSGDLMTSRGIRVRFTDTADDAAWTLPVFALAYKVLPGLVERL